MASANKRGLGKGRDKVRECWGVGIGRTAGRSSIGELEQKLRDDLTGVDLVCEADPAPGELQMAEEVCRAAFASGDYDGLATRRPAILVSYVAIRGAEWCEGIRVWPQLGVTEYSSRAGQAFLTALRRLGLPDFQQMVRQERARRYVAPILIHGGIPALRASAGCDGGE